MAEKVRNRWSVVFGAVLIQICLGAVYAWSVFNKPLVEQYGWDLKSVALTFSITIMTFATATIFAGKIQDQIGPRWVATAGGLLLGIGVILSGLTLGGDSPIKLYIFYGIIGGIGIGAAYVCPLATCLKWFPDMRGLISGIAVAGFGAGALVFKPIIMNVFLPMGLTKTFLYLGVIYLVAVVIGAQFLVVPPPGYRPPGWTPPATAAGTAGGADFSTAQMLGTLQFYLLWVMYLFGCTAGLMVIGLATDIGIKLVKLTASTAANAVMIIAVFNALGRIAWGTISDRLGRMRSLLLMYLIAATAMFFMSKASMTYATFLGACSLIGFCFGGFLALFPSITADFYGTKNVGTNYGIIFVAYGTAAIVGPMIGASLEFVQAFLIAAVLCVVAAGMTFIVKQPAAPTR